MKGVSPVHTKIRSWYWVDGSIGDMYLYLCIYIYVHTYMQILTYTYKVPATRPRSDAQQSQPEVPQSPDPKTTESVPPERCIYTYISIFIYIYI